MSSGDGRLKAQGRSSNRLELTGKVETSRLRTAPSQAAEPWEECLRAAVKDRRTCCH